VLRARIGDWLELLKLSLRLQLGRRGWLVPALALIWPAYSAVALLLGWREQSFIEREVQNGLIGLPIYLLAVGLGVRIIASEIEQRTLEVTYTVPGGAKRVWISKLIGALLPLALAGLLNAIFTAIFLTPYPLQVLYGALQGAAFYLVLGMGLGALFRSEITAALVGSVVLLLNGFVTGFGELQTRWSPLFNPVAANNVNEADLLAFTLQNRIGFALLIVALAALACARAERREQLLRI
jgi:hypothetical protein